MQIRAGAGVQGKPLIDQGPVQPRILARAQDGIEHVERRLIRIPPVRHLVRNDHRPQFAGPLTMTRRAPLCGGSSVYTAGIGCRRARVAP